MPAGASGQNLFDGLSVVFLEPLSARHVEPRRSDTELMQNRCVNIRDIVPVLDGVKTEFIGCAMGDAPLMPPPAIHTLNPKG